MGDPLAALNAVMDWTIFDPVLARLPRAETKAPGGRPAYPPATHLVFKILVLQSLYGLSDEQAQFQTLDRRSFQHFLGLTEADPVPDQNTIREFREKLTRAELFTELFAASTRGWDPARLHHPERPDHRRVVCRSAPATQPARGERRDKRGEVPAGWEADAKRLAHKDLDARWTKKNQQTYYGYKDHLVADLESKLIVRAEVTAASEHDSQALDPLTRAGDPATWADSAYAGAKPGDFYGQRHRRPRLRKRRARPGPEQKDKSGRTGRSPAGEGGRKHIFGFKTGSMGAMFHGRLGMRATGRGSLVTNLVYNLARTEQIIRLKLLGRKTPKLA